MPLLRSTKANPLLARLAGDWLHNGSWTINGASFVNAPGAGLELLTNPSFDIDAGSWTGVNAAVASVANGQVNNCLQVTNSPGGATGYAYQGVSTVAGDWLVAQFYYKRNTPGGLAYLASTSSGNNIAASPVYTDANFALKALTGLAIGTTTYLRFLINGTTNGQFGQWDEASVKKLIGNQLFVVKPDKAAPGAVSAKLSQAAGCVAGVVVNLDSLLNPQNFIVAWHTGISSAFMYKCVNGVYTQIAFGSASFVDGATLEVRQNGANTWEIWYNGSKVGSSAAVNDASIVSNILHGGFSTHTANTLQDITITPATAVDTNVLYVDKSGSDSNLGTAASPYLTIGKASTVASTNLAITEIRVGPGTYSEILTVPRDNLTYRANGAAGTVIIDAGGTNKAVYTADYSNINIVGFYAQNGSWLYDCRAGRNVAFYNCVAHDCSRGFYAVGATNPYFYNCVAYNTSDTVGAFYLYNGTTGALVQGCEAYNATGRGFYAYLNSTNNVFRDCYAHDPPANSYGFEVEDGCTGCQYIRCWAIGVGSRFLNGLISKKSSGTRFEGCVASQVDSAGIYFKNGTNGFAYNNVTNDCHRGFLLADNLGSDPSIGNTLRNNIILNNDLYGMEVATGSESGLVLDYNNYYNNTSALVVFGVSAKTSLAQLQAAGYEAHGFTLNPAYASPAYGGFTLPAGSPLKNVGYYLGGADLTPDLGRDGSAWDGYKYN